MTYARKNLVSLSDTPYYHIITRCVRRAWLWGVDEYANRDYSHRKNWILQRLAELSAIYTIEICAYAVMSNHYHLVIYVDQQRALDLTAEEVVQRWSELYGLPLSVQRWRSGEADAAEDAAAQLFIGRWRNRLCDLSWFMKSLNEHLARRANAEDECSGKFWEARFKSQALLDEAGLLTAMAYVDLNPIRAGVARTPEESQFTSIYQRIRRTARRAGAEAGATAQPHLRAFCSGVGTRSSIPFTLRDYLELVDWTGKARREDKRGAIDQRLPMIMCRLNIDPDAWCKSMRPRGNVFGRALGRLDYMRLHARTLGQSWVRGLQAARLLYAPA